MADTTPSAITGALKTLIEALTPKGGTSRGVESVYKHLSDHYSGWDDRPESDMDRQFRLLGIVPQEETSFGGVSITDEAGIFRLEIGHVCGQFQADRDRRDEDLMQLARQVQLAISDLTFRTATSNAVSRIWHVGTDQPEEHGETGNFWVSLMEFEINYSIAWNYGG